ncbi:DUF4389 domain-containing protein [Actinomycetes bacterium KLBMP 9797]
MSSSPDSAAVTEYPITVRAWLDQPLRRWLWLVKWLLLIPHYIVLLVLWLVFAVLTIVAFFAILFTARYPRALFEFNVGVLRWSWRVSYYGYEALGTDRYPPFTLADVPDYPARLRVTYPEDLNRWLPLVKWLLAIPHILIIGALTSGAWWAYRDDGGGARGSMSLLSVFVLIVAVALLFTGRYPMGLFDLLVGFARWIYRVVAYVTLMTDRYPPFRLDLGGEEPASGRAATDSGS